MLVPLDCLLDYRQQVQNIRTREAKELEMSGGGLGSMARLPPNLGGGHGGAKGQQAKDRCGHFQMPLHYPRYTRPEYETMPEWKLDCLLTEYGLSVSGDVNQKRKFAMGAFLWSC